MLFNSFAFWVFFPIVYALYFLTPLRVRLFVLLAASFYFYMYWSVPGTALIIDWSLGSFDGRLELPVGVPYVSLLLLAASANFLAGRCLARSDRPRSRKLWLFAGLSVSLGVLGFFKYYNFFLDSLRNLQFAPGWLPASKLLLPLGISFYTFQAMSYSIDLYRGRVREERSFLKFLLYVIFFPQLVAGPIVRASDLLPQFDVQQQFDWDNFHAGIRRVLSGFIKKVVIADNLAVIVNAVYTDPDHHSGLALLLATYAFAFQIYCDFSGYSEIAIGLARMMGNHFKEKFDSPYVSRSIQEFWRRWHISLSTWLRDYLYIPLGGNRHGGIHTYKNLIVTMLLGGLWHGASWNFVIWGAIHGVWLAIERLITRGFRDARHATMPEQGKRRSLWGVWKVVLVFHGACLAWVFFRAQTLHEALAVLHRVGTWAPGANPELFRTCYAILISLLGGLYFALAYLGDRRSERWWWAAGLFGVVLIVLFGQSSNEFIYFVF